MKQTRGRCYDYRNLRFCRNHKTEINVLIHIICKAWVKHYRSSAPDMFYSESAVKVGAMTRIIFNTAT